MGDPARYLTGPLGQQTRPKVIEFRHVTVIQKSRVMLQDITLNIFEGESIALLGAPDSGKSELLACVQGQLQPVSGEILLLGTALPSLSAALQHQVGSMPQNIDRQTHETVAEYLQRFAAYRTTHINEEQILAYCAQYQLSVSLPVARLTSLQERIFALALALVHDPRLVLLDEPMAGLTEQEQFECWTYLQRTRREGRTLLCTCSEISGPMIWDRVIWIR